MTQPTIPATVPAPSGTRRGRRPAQALPLCLALLAGLAQAAPPLQGPKGAGGVGASVGGVSQGGQGQNNVLLDIGDNAGNTQGVAQAALRSGSLHALAWSSNNPTLPRGCRPDMLSCNWGVGASAWLWEKVTLKAGPGYVPGQSVPWVWDVDGSWQHGKWWSAARAETWFSISTRADGWQTASYINLRYHDGLLMGSVEVPADGTPLVLYVYGALSVYAEGGAVSDYSHTATFRWTLPRGVEASSSSGQFLAAVVPEPGSAGLLASGLLALPWLARRRRGPVRG